MFTRIEPDAKRVVNRVNAFAHRRNGKFQHIIDLLCAFAGSKTSGCGVLTAAGISLDELLAIAQEEFPSTELTVNQPVLPESPELMRAYELAEQMATCQNGVVMELHLLFAMSLQPCFSEIVNKWKLNALPVTVSNAFAEHIRRLAKVVHRPGGNVAR